MWHVLLVTTATSSPLIAAPTEYHAEHHGGALRNNQPNFVPPAQDHTTGVTGIPKPSDWGALTFNATVTTLELLVKDRLKDQLLPEAMGDTEGAKRQQNADKANIPIAEKGINTVLDKIQKAISNKNDQERIALEAFLRHQQIEYLIVSRAYPDEIKNGIIKVIKDERNKTANSQPR